MFCLGFRGSHFLSGSCTQDYGSFTLMPGSGPLKLSATASRDDKAVFQVELLYGGLFEITGVPQEHLEPVLLIECPRFLFPFARRIIADATAEGGFPPFLLEPIDFSAVYAAQQAQRTQLAESGTVGTA